MQEDQKLWDILGQASRSPAPPFFAGKVMRAIQEADAPDSSWRGRFFRWLAPATIAALLVLALGESMRPATNVEPPLTTFTTLDLVEMVNPNDYQILIEAGWPYDNGFLSTNL